MAYEVWEITSGNLAGTYGTAEKALAVVQAFVQRHGPPAATRFSLVRTGPRGKRTTIACGDDLIAMAVAPAAVSRTDVIAPGEAQSVSGSSRSTPA